MNYEEKYNKAFEHARQAYGTGVYDDQTLEAIFPELRESEDERIRKELIETVKCIADGDAIFLSEQQEQRYLAWLEKQKVNTEGDFGRGYDCGYQAGYAVAMNEVKPKVATPTLDSEKQKEQKPINWTELTWKDINEIERIINNVHYEFPHGIGEESFGKEVLERFREYKDDDSMDEQKPAEWNQDCRIHKKFIENGKQ